jgi:hypothetical protein
MADVIDNVRERFKNTQKSDQPLKLLRYECKAIAKNLTSKGSKAGVKNINGISVNQLQAAFDGKVSFKDFDFGIGIQFEYMG